MGKYEVVMATIDLEGIQYKYYLIQCSVSLMHYISKNTKNQDIIIYC